MTEDNETPTRKSPESLRLSAISPSLTVNSVDESLAFYRDIVGFAVKELWENEGKVLGASLIAGTQTLMIGQDDWAKGRDRDKGIGTRLYFTATQSADAVADAIKARGGTLASEPDDMPWGGRAFSMVDPDGFHFTIVSD